MKTILANTWGGPPGPQPAPGRLTRPHTPSPFTGEFPPVRIIRIVRIRSEMVASTSVSPVREILESRLSQTILEMEKALDSHFSTRVAEELERDAARITADVRERSQRELADHLNQAVRRMRQAPDGTNLGVALLDAAAPFASSAALFRVDHAMAIGEGIRGVPETDKATSSAA